MNNTCLNSKNQDGSLSYLNNGEISLVDIRRFLKGAWKLIVIAGLAGASLSIAYLAFTPKQFQATAQILMAQVRPANSDGVKLTSLGVNIEEPVLLIARLSSPTSFTPQVIAACGFSGQLNAAGVLSKSIKLTVPKGLSNVVELSTFGASPEAAKECNSALFELIKTTQAQILTPYIVNAKVTLDDRIERLAKARDLVTKLDKSGSAVGGVAYLSTRDEIRYLLDEIALLRSEIASSQNRATRLLAPIYSGDIPVAPSKRTSLALGLFVGLFVGLLIALVRIYMVRIRGNVGGAL